MPFTFDYQREDDETAEAFAKRAHPGIDILDSLAPENVRRFHGGTTDKGPDGWQEITFTFECKTNP